MLGRVGPVFPDTRQERRELARRVIALDPQVDQAIGESGELRYRLATLQTAVRGLLGSLDGWRGVATHLSQSPRDEARAGCRSHPARTARSVAVRDGFASAVALDGRLHGPARPL